MSADPLKLPQEDVADIQLAWENLEMARQIYSAPPLGPSSVELAQVHLKLGQLSMEQAQLDEALADYAEALSLFRRHLEPDHRRITAVLYEIAVALELQMDYGGALGRIREALGLCGTRVAALRARAGANELAEETASLEGVLEDLRRKGPKWALAMPCPPPPEPITHFSFSHPPWPRWGENTTRFLRPPAASHSRPASLPSAWPLLARLFPISPSPSFLPSFSSPISPAEEELVAQMADAVKTKDQLRQAFTQMAGAWRERALG